jgi:hypothetical protein
MTVWCPTGNALRRHINYAEKYEISQNIGVIRHDLVWIAWRALLRKESCPFHRPGTPRGPENGSCERGLRNYVRIDFSFEFMRNVDRHIKKQGAAPPGTAACVVSAADKSLF